MSSPLVGFNSYVDIAICMVIQQSDYRKLHQSVLDRWESKEIRKSKSKLTETTFEANPQSLLRLEWSKRIKEWQKLYPDNGPRVENWTSLEEFVFGPFFLHHPISAMSLWNVMQAFYALDRFVCCTSKESRDRIAEWESMPLFEYLGAKRVEKRWRTSLQNLRKEIENENNDNAPLPRMLFGVKKLEEACDELRRSLNENLKGVRLVESMLKQITVAAGRRYSMIEKYLEMDGTHSGETLAAKAIKSIESNSSTSGLKSEKSNSTPEETRVFKPLSRTRSIDVIKKHLLIAWVSTKKGEATLSAIFVLLMSIFILYQLKTCLVVLPES